MSELEDKESRNPEGFEESTPFQHKEITGFYNKNQGDDANKFIRATPLFRDYHGTIHALLNFLDRHGNTDLIFDCKYKIAFEQDPKSDPETPYYSVSLREHTLIVANKMLRFHRINDHDLSNSHFNFGLIKAGIAALSYNIGLGLGREYCSLFNSDTGQASLAVLEHMPAVHRLKDFEEIKEIVRLYHLYTHRSMDYSRSRFLEANHSDRSSVPAFVQFLIHADMEAKRKIIFRHAGNTEALWPDGKTRKAAESTARIIVKQAEIERQQHIAAMEEELKRKKDAYIDELKGLRNDRDQLKTEIKIKDKIISALKKNDKKAEKLAVEELKNLRQSIRDKGKEETAEHPQESESSTTATQS